MSEMYDAYLVRHKKGVKEAFDWIQENVPEVLAELDKDIDWQIEFGHDESKKTREEYLAYDLYFYPIASSRSYQTIRDFEYAWLHHIHNNPHHWQHWVLINDDDGTKALEMPFEYVVEMICDWWSFSFVKGNLREIFTWYEDHKDKMILHKNTRKAVEDILKAIKRKLDEIDKELGEEFDKVLEENKQYVEEMVQPKEDDVPDLSGLEHGEDLDSEETEETDA